VTIEIKDNQIFALSVGEGYQPTGDHLLQETPLGHYVLEEKPNWLTGDYKPYVFVNRDIYPINTSLTGNNWVVAMRQNNQIDLIIKPNDFDHQVFLSGFSLTELELPSSMLNEKKKEIDINFVDRFYCSEIFEGANNNNFKKQIQYKPTGVSVTTNRGDIDFVNYPDRRSINVKASNKLNPGRFVFIVGNESDQDAFIDMSSLETAIPNNSFINRAFENHDKFSVYELNQEGKKIFGEEFSLDYAKNVYIGALNEDEKCCVGGLVFSEQRLDMNMPVKNGSKRLSLATPTPTPSATTSSSNTPPPTPSTSNTPTVTPTTTPSVSRTQTPSPSKGSPPSPSPTHSTTSSPTPTPTQTPSKTPTPSLSVGAKRPLPKVVAILNNPLENAPIDFVGNFILRDDKISYINLSGEYALLWQEKNSRWKFKNLKTGNFIGYSAKGDQYESLITLDNNPKQFITYFDDQNRTFFYTVIRSELTEPLPDANMIVPLSGPLAGGKKEKIKITALGKRNVRVFIWRDQGAGANIGDFNFKFDSTKKHYGINTFSSTPTLVDTKYYRRSQLYSKNTTNRFLFLPKYYPTAKYLGGNQDHYLSLDKFIPRPYRLSYNEYHQWETSSASPIFGNGSLYPGGLSSNLGSRVVVNEDVQIAIGDTLHIFNNTDQVFEIRAANFKTILFSIAPYEEIEITSSSAQQYYGGYFKIVDNFDNFSTKYGQIKISFKDYSLGGIRNEYDRDTIVYESPSRTVYTGNVPPLFSSWDYKIYDRAVNHNQITVFRSGSRENEIDYDNLEFLIGGLRRHPVKVKDLVNFINNDSRLRDVVSAEYFGDGMTPLSFKPISGYADAPSIVPFDFFKEKTYFQLTNLENVDLNILADDEEADFGEEELTYINIDIPKNNDQKKYFNLSQIKVNLDKSKVELDIDYILMQDAVSGMSITFSIYEEGKGKLLASEESFPLDHNSPRFGSHVKNLNNLFDKLPIRGSQNYKKRSSGKLYLLVELKDLASTMQLIKSDIITSKIVDGIDKRDNFYKSENFIETGVSFDNVPEKGHELSYQVEPLRSFTNDPRDIDYSRLKILLPYSWRIVKNATLRVRVLPAVETKSTSNLDLNFIDGKIFNKNGLGKNNISIEGQDNPDSYFWANSSNGYPGKNKTITQLDPYNQDTIQTSDAEYFVENLKVRVSNNNDILKNPTSSQDVPEEHFLFLEADKIQEIIIPISQDPDSKFFLDANEEPYIYTPWLNCMKGGNVYFTMSLMCGQNFEETNNFEDSVEGAYKNSLNQTNLELESRYGEYIQKSTIGLDVASIDTYAHYYDVDRNNSQYQVFSWGDGYWSKQKIIIYSGEETEDGLPQEYGTVEFESNERYKLTSIDNLPSDAKSFENNPDVIGSAIGRYYKYEGTPVRRGNTYYATKGISNPKILKHLKDNRVAQIVYDAYYKQEVLLKDLKSTFNSLWDGTHEIFFKYKNSNVMADIEGWSYRPDANLPKNSVDETLYPYAFPSGKEGEVSYPLLFVRKMLMYLYSTQYNVLNYNTYLDPRAADGMHFELRSFTFARDYNEEFSKILSLEMSDLRGKNTENPLSYDQAIPSPFKDLDVTPQIFIGENGCVIYREPVFASIPFINLFTNILCNNINAYRGAEILKIPFLGSEEYYGGGENSPYSKKFPINATKSTIGDDGQGIVFGKVHEDIFFNFEPWKMQDIRPTHDLIDPSPLDNFLNLRYQKILSQIEDIEADNARLLEEGDPAGMLNYNNSIINQLQTMLGSSEENYSNDGMSPYAQWQLTKNMDSYDITSSSDEYNNYYQNDIYMAQWEDSYDGYSDMNYPDDTYGEMGSEGAYYENSYSNNTYGVGGEQREKINVLKRLSSDLKLAVNVLYGIKWNVVYPAKVAGDAYLLKEYNVKVKEGYSNDFRPSNYYDTIESLEYKFRNGNLFGQTLGLKSDDPFYSIAQGNEFVKVYGSLLEENAFAIDPEEYKKIFWSYSEWVTKLRNDNSNPDNPNYGKASRYIDLVNFFNGNIKYFINNFPFKEFGMEAF